METYRQSLFLGLAFHTSIAIGLPSGAAFFLPGQFRTEGLMWKPVRVFNKDTVPMVLTFDALSAAQAYVGRNQPGAVPIVRVTEDEEREMVETGCL
jgi:hypothetical protein